MNASLIAEYNDPIGTPGYKVTYKRISKSHAEDGLKK
jgi:hypothetical protein